MRLRPKKKSLVDQAADYVDAIKPHVEAAVDSAVDFAHDTALPALKDAKDKAVPVLKDARDKAAPVLADARDKAAPVLADARDRAVAGLSDARDAAAPYVSQGADYAAERAGAARELAEARVAQLKGEQPKKKSKLKRFVLVAGVAGAVVFVAKKLQGGSSSSDNWQSSYTPSPAPSTPSSPATPTPAAPQAGLEDSSDDTAGATPGEAIADATEAPQPVSTPDEPAEVVDVEKNETGKHAG